MKEIHTKYAGVDIYIKRPVLGSIHERAFYTIFAIGKSKKIFNENGDILPIQACEVDFYKFKEYAGFDPTTNWEHIKKIIEDLRLSSFEIRQKNERMVNVQHLIEFFKIEKTASKNKKKNKYILTIILSNDLIKLFNFSTYFSIPPDVIKEVNNIFREAHLHRTVMYFLTQSRNHSISFEKLMLLIDSEAENWMADRKKKWKVKQKFRLQKKNLLKYNIITEEKERDFLFHFERNSFQFIGYAK